jgi:hypothetical protein
MVGEGGGTPAVSVGNYLHPQTSPDDTDGYYVANATATNAWFIVTKVDSARQEVEARMLF